jgi:hypothetical protein
MAMSSASARSRANSANGAPSRRSCGIRKSAFACSSIASPITRSTCSIRPEK